MNKLITTSNGGFPIELDDLRFSDNAYRDGFKALVSPFADVNNDALILSGMVRSQQGQLINYTEGYCMLFGEIMYFPEHNLPLLQQGQFEYLQIDSSFDNNGNKTLENGIQVQSHQVRTAKIVRATSQPLNAIIWAFVKSYFTEIANKINTVPQGVIMMWSGSIANIPQGYALCDGSNGTPDLRGKFVVGFDATKPDYSAISLIGGEEKHTLTVAEMPAHTHTNVGNVAVSPGSGFAGGSSASVTAQKGNTLSTGGNESHENRPPYYVIAYIIKL
ncbi:MAG: hypothetical protein RQ856_05065 [Candidatus Izemoplasmatales bacterium]|nr:hypothetical protein [Candidatus Izemoplasmatales bacterium]